MLSKKVTIFWGNSYFIVQNSISSRKHLCFKVSIMNGSDGIKGILLDKVSQLQYSSPKFSLLIITFGTAAQFNPLPLSNRLPCILVLLRENSGPTITEYQFGSNYNRSTDCWKDKINNHFDNWVNLLMTLKPFQILSHCPSHKLDICFRCIYITM